MEANRYRFRAWDGLRGRMMDGYSFGMNAEGIAQRFTMFDTFEDYPDWVVMQSTGLTDKNGVELFDDDVVYLAGYGDYLCVFPYAELYEAAAENDIGALKGNIHQNPSIEEGFLS